VGNCVTIETNPTRERIALVTEDVVSVSSPPSKNKGIGISAVEAANFVSSEVL
jgi:hypothetical protein